MKTLVLLAALLGADWKTTADSAMAKPAEVRDALHRQAIVNLKTGQGIPTNALLMGREWLGIDPEPQAYSLALYLTSIGGDERYRQLESRSSWTEAFRRLYGFPTLGHLQTAWVAWLTQNQVTYQLGST